MNTVRFGIIGIGNMGSAHALNLAAGKVKEAVVFTRDEDAIWECSNCGHIVIGKKAPEVCPVCDHPQSYFQVKAENY